MWGVGCRDKKETLENKLKTWVSAYTLHPTPQTLIMGIGHQKKLPNCSKLP
ncbi:MAG: hypothetical protein F6J93_36505 [Oscillatoria sp. SIO1A7]|nr:hypothetical protein [Oscillatoria sp. SIO1A7]